MSPPRVWAPRAQHLRIETGGQNLPMQSLAGGWWQADAPLAHGADYAFALDGRAALPDPRSPWQPRGVHGPSRWLDHAAFAWEDAAWQPPAWGGAVIYELHVGTFTPEGTFAAAMERLDHLTALGITHVELMPVAEFSGRRGWGYDGVDLFAPHHHYGGPEGLKRLINACHRRGLAVLLDVVYNHLGPAGNYLAQYGPYFTRRYQTPWGEALNFDGADSGEVRQFFLDNARMWLRDYHCDGLRLDAVHAILDASAYPFLEQLAAAARAWEAELVRPLLLIAESDNNDSRLSAPPEAGGIGLDAQWNEDFHHALHACLTGEHNGYYADFGGGLEDLAAVLRRIFLYDGRYSRYRRRHHGRPAAGADGRRFVAYAQNHDQIGNRAQGERLSQLLRPGQLKIAAALVLTSPFIPLLFQGEEWGAGAPFLYFTDHPEPELARAVREGRQREFATFGWSPEAIPDPQAEDTFARSHLRWEELTEPAHAELLRWHRELIALRRQSSLSGHATGPEANVVSVDPTARWLTVRRQDWLMSYNFAPDPQAVPLPAGPWRLRLASAPGAEAAGGALRLPPESVAILH
ncbi:MAG: malto-oligosyltrehalose trehalohydrolase [Terriglobales bacterium]